MGSQRAHLALASASARIRAMEDTLGLALFERHRSGVTATRAGLAVAHHARLVLQQPAAAGVCQAVRIEQALYELDVINTRAPTGERQKLLGGAWKRLAWVHTGRPRVEALLNMASYYREAFESCGSNDAYAFNNWAVACLLLAHIDPGYDRGDWVPALADLCTRQLGTTCKLNDDDPSFWTGTGIGDLPLVQLLLSVPLNDARAQPVCIAASAAAQYATAFARGASLCEIASIQENLDLLIELTGDEAQPWPAAVRGALDTIRRTAGVAARRRSEPAGQDRTRLPCLRVDAVGDRGAAPDRQPHHRRRGAARRGAPGPHGASAGARRFRQFHAEQRRPQPGARTGAEEQACRLDRHQPAHRGPRPRWNWPAGRRPTWSISTRSSASATTRAKARTPAGSTCR